MKTSWVRASAVSVALPVLMAWQAGTEPAIAQSVATTRRVSVASDGTQANGGSRQPAISAAGRLIAFSSWATNLVPGDLLGSTDMFLHDLSTSQTQRISVGWDGAEGNNHSGLAAISADERFIVFDSFASNLVPNDTNRCLLTSCSDIFVFDRQTGQTTRVSVTSDGSQALDGDSGIPAISADGRIVAFHSFALNLAPVSINDFSDVFVHDRQTGETTRVSVGPDGTEGNENSMNASLSADGRFVVFDSAASNLIPGDTNSWPDVFVHDRRTGQTRRVSVATDGTQGDMESSHASISADGRFVAFNSLSSNFVSPDPGFYDIFVRDRQTGETTRVSGGLGGLPGNGNSIEPKISAEGRFISFKSKASNLVLGDTNHLNCPNCGWDIFVHDRWTGRTERVSVADSGAQGNHVADYHAISADGRSVAFESLSSNLVAGDTNDLPDEFVRDRNPSAPLLSRMLIYEYQWSGGGVGSLTALLFANGRFRDSDRNTGRWGYQTAQQRYVLVYDSGQFCNAVSVAAFTTAPSVQGQTFCRDGSGATATWQGSLYVVDGGTLPGDVTMASDGRTEN